MKERGGELRRQIKNPYNRNSMKNEIPKIHRLCQLRRLLKGEYKKHILPTRIHVRNRDVSSPQNDLRNRTLSIGLEHNYNHSQMLEMIRSIRSKSNEDRTRELFIEIDQLGNYSDYRWFINFLLIIYNE